MAAPSGGCELLPAASINSVIRQVCADKGVSFGSGAKDAIIKAATMSIFQLMDDACDNASRAKRAGVTGLDIVEALRGIGSEREANAVLATVTAAREAKRKSRASKALVSTASAAPAAEDAVSEDEKEAPWGGAE